VSLPLVAEVVRSGFVESVHRGSVVAVDPGGSVAFSLGEFDVPILPRSANKPLQATGMRALGLELEDELLALSAASHSGEPRHLDGATRILAGAGLDESDLRCPPDVPYGSAARLAWTRSGRGLERIAMNCSGKHAAMLATCVLRGWPVTTYVDAEHPLQLALRATVEEHAREAVSAVAVDGCGAPLFGLTLLGLARAVGSLVTSGPTTSGRAVADAMRAHPEWVGGIGREATRLMQGVPGLLAKDGAEGVYVAALDDGRAVALKIDDGAARGCLPVLVAALRALGVDGEVLDELAETPVHGGDRQVGVIRARAGLFG
jgi:L-asparaginase II